ncbi:MAG: VWA domain-containing protein [Desulfobacterales bacterium]|nr:VWA domain-containing protein [Desulfobacterales bacterium]
MKKNIFERKYYLKKCLFLLILSHALFSCLDRSDLSLKLKLSGQTQPPSSVILSFTVEDQSGNPIAPRITDNDVVIVGDVDESTRLLLPPYLRTVLMLDLSASVTKNHLSFMIDSAKHVVNTLIPMGHEIAIDYFQSEITQLSDFTNDINLLNAKLDSLTKAVVSGASTNVFGAFIAGLDHLDTEAEIEKVKPAGFLIVFTDGKDAANVYSYEETYEAVRSSEYYVFTVGIKTSELQSKILDERHLGKNGFELIDTPELDHFKSAFQNMVNTIRHESDKYYVLIYSSPLRAGTHTIQFQVTSADDRVASSTYTFDANGFTDGGHEVIEQLKHTYYDKDGDGFYSVQGPFYDCCDNDPLIWYQGQQVDQYNYNLKVNLFGSITAPAIIGLTLKIEDELGNAVSPQLTEPNFTFLEDGKPLNPLETNLTLYPPLHHSLIMLDLSGSITQDNLNILSDSANGLANRLIADEHQVAVYIFQTQVKKVLDFTTDPKQIDEVVNEYSLREYAISGSSTNLYGAFIEGIQAVEHVFNTEDHVTTGNLIVFTDGQDTSALYSYDQAKTMVDRTHHLVFTIALNTNELDRTVLDTEHLGKDGAVFANSIREIGTVFTNISGLIQQESNKFYGIMYATAYRGDSYHQFDIFIDTFQGNKGKAAFQFNASGLADGGYDMIEDIKYLYFDKDGDGYYSVSGKNHDRFDTNPVWW